MDENGAPAVLPGVGLRWQRWAEGVGIEHFQPNQPTSEAVKYQLRVVPSCNGESVIAARSAAAAPPDWGDYRGTPQLE